MSQVPATTTMIREQYRIVSLTINCHGQNPLHVDCLLPEAQAEALRGVRDAPAQLSVHAAHGTWTLPDEDSPDIHDETPWQLSGHWRNTFLRDEWVVDEFGVLIPPHRYHYILGVSGSPQIHLSYTSFYLLNRLLHRLSPVWQALAEKLSEHTREMRALRAAQEQTQAAQYQASARVAQLLQLLGSAGALDRLAALLAPGPQQPAE